MTLLAVQSPIEGNARYALPQTTRWLCVAVMALIVDYQVPRLFSTVAWVFNDSAVVNEFWRWRSVDVAGFVEWQRWALLTLNVALNFGPNAVAWGFAFSMFGGFRHGEVFTSVAANRLFAAGLFTFLFPLFQVPRQVLVLTVMTAHLPLAQHWQLPGFDAEMIHDLALGAAILALAYVHKVAAEMADDSAQIL